MWGARINREIKKKRDRMNQWCWRDECVKIKKEGNDAKTAELPVSLLLNGGKSLSLMKRQNQWRSVQKEAK